MNGPIDDGIDDGVDARIAEALRRHARTQPIAPPGLSDVRRRVARRRRRLATTGAAAVLAPAVVGLVALSQRDPRTTPPSAGVGLDADATPTTVLPSGTARSTTTTAPVTVLETPSTYTIQEGDYPSTVSRMFGVSYEDFMALNGFELDEQGFLPQWVPGLVVRIPAGATVASGAPPSPTTVVVTEGYRCFGPIAIEDSVWYFADCETIGEPIIVGTAPSTSVDVASQTTTSTTGPSVEDEPAISTTPPTTTT